MFNLNKKKLTIIEIVVVILLFILFFWGRNNNKNTENIIPITPVPTPNNINLLHPEEKNKENPSQTEIEQIQKEDTDYLKTHPLWKILPFQSERFKIDHYSKPMTLVIYISKNENQEEIKTLVNNWIISKGINPPNHNIEFKFQN